jgi:PAS domain-containing protein
MLPTPPTDEMPRRLLDAVRDEAVFALDMGGRVTWWNAGAEKVFGLPAAEAMGRHCSALYAQEDVALGMPSAVRRSPSAITIHRSPSTDLRSESPTNKKARASARAFVLPSL